MFSRSFPSRRLPSLNTKVLVLSFCSKKEKSRKDGMQDLLNNFTVYVLQETENFRDKNPPMVHVYTETHL